MLIDKTMIIKALGVSSLIYSSSNINVPNDIAGNVKRRLFCFPWKNKRDKVKSEGLYQDYDNGGLRMTDIETAIKALRLAWIPRLMQNGQSNWKFAPDHLFRTYGGLQFLLTCNYHVKYLKNMPLLRGIVTQLYDDRNKIRATTTNLWLVSCTDAAG